MNIAPILRFSERTQWDVFDSFNPRELRPGHAMCMFGPHNVGNMFRSNLQVANQAADGEFFVTNWCARTNIFTPPAEFHAFASGTIITLNVNHGQMCSAPLAELLRRDQVKPNLLSREELAVHLHHAVDGRLDNSIWPGLSEDEREHWRTIGDAARRHINEMPETIAHIPMHEEVAVRICPDKRALSALLEVLPTNVAPETLVWVHLEGVRRRAVT